MAVAFRALQGIIPSVADAFIQGHRFRDGKQRFLGQLPSSVKPEQGICRDGEQGTAMAGAVNGQRCERRSHPYPTERWIEPLQCDHEVELRESGNPRRTAR